MTSNLDTCELTLDDVIRHAVDGVFAIDNSHRIVLFSDSCEQILGMDAATVAGAAEPCHKLTDCRDEQDRPLSGILCPGLGILSGETQSARQRINLRHGEGRRVWIETTYSPVYSEGGQVTHVVGIMRDVTEAKRLEDELREKAADKAKCAGDHVAAITNDPRYRLAETGQAPPTEGFEDMGPLDQILTTIERREILAALNRANGQRTLAARLLGISRSRLYRRMEALGIDPRELGDAGETPLRQDA